MTHELAQGAGGVRDRHRGHAQQQTSRDEKRFAEMECAHLTGAGVAKAVTH
ncbi:MAG: hypothetical protein M3308_09605 [Actinomycetota bacterium]|nr:hypothetical protein [Actinomycetota bacterium]